MTPLNRLSARPPRGETTSKVKILFSIKDVTYVSTQMSIIGSIIIKSFMYGLVTARKLRDTCVDVGCNLHSHLPIKSLLYKPDLIIPSDMMF